MFSRSRTHMLWNSVLYRTLIAAPLAFSATAARSAVTISSDATSAMDCAGGTCSPTAKSAVLNASDLETLLASGNVTVTTKGDGATQADDIVVAASVSWTASNTLKLDAHESIAIDKPVSVAGHGGLALVTNDGGTGGALSFGPKGNANFANLSSSLTINGSAYTLVSSIKKFASAITAKPNGDYALAQSFNAKLAGTYASSPIATTLTGAFEGLSNAIKDLSIDDTATTNNVGLFATIGTGGTVSGVVLTNASVTGGASSIVGALAGLNSGTISQSSAAGSVAAGDSADVGGLVGRNYEGTISQSTTSNTVTDGGSADLGGLAGLNYDAVISGSHATGKITGGINQATGGLVGVNYTDGAAPATISQSYARGAGSGADEAGVGGLVGANQSSGSLQATVSQCFATGTVAGGTTANVGGLVGYNQDAVIENSYATGDGSMTTNGAIGGLVGLDDTGSSIANSYSTGTVSGGSGTDVGGYLGYDNNLGSITDSYWDTTTSGITNLSEGAGNISNDAGITGLTTTQLQSGLPAGFAASIWAEKLKTNGGLPYLRANPPPK